MILRVKIGVLIYHSSALIVNVDSLSPSIALTVEQEWEVPIMRRNKEHEKDLELAHKMFDERNLITELRWQRKYLDTGYLSVTQVLFNKWIFDECLKRLEERKVGKWIELTNKTGTVMALRCDCCGKSPKHAIRSLYCPNCGAEMRKE